MTLTLRHWAITHPGTRRTTNEDAFLCRPEIGLFAVADGVGGRSGGEFASAEVMRQLGAIPDTVAPRELLSAVRARLQSVHDRLRATEACGQRDTPATTVVVLLLSGGYLACVWAGDSRAYLLRDGELLRLTSDHSLVGELVRAGKLTDAQAERHPGGHVITRALGVASGGALVDKVVASVQLGDRFLLCSDGLSKSLSADDIGVHMSAADPAAALLEAALAANARDNVTALVAQV
jgi:protein phosphatase/serine/threonine-protein phosphatase Stp1